MQSVLFFVIILLSKKLNPCSCDPSIAVVRTFGFGATIIHLTGLNYLTKSVLYNVFKRLISFGTLEPKIMLLMNYVFFQTSLEAMWK